MTQSVLIIGGTGMLTKASKYVATIAQSVTLASRHPQTLASEINATPMILDWNDRDQTLADIYALSPIDLVISWLHDDGLWLVEHLENRLRPSGRSIRIHGSASLNPEVLAKQAPPSRDDIQRQVIVLGWANTKTGRRWLTNDEINNPVINAIQQPKKLLIIAGTTKTEYWLEILLI
jgi:hypothetical protein